MMVRTLPRWLRSLIRRWFGPRAKIYSPQRRAVQRCPIRLTLERLEEIAAAGSVLPLLMSFGGLPLAAATMPTRTPELERPEDAAATMALPSDEAVALADQLFSQVTTEEDASSETSHGSGDRDSFATLAAPFQTAASTLNPLSEVASGDFDPLINPNAQAQSADHGLRPLPTNAGNSNPPNLAGAYAGASQGPGGVSNLNPSGGGGSSGGGSLNLQLPTQTQLQQMLAGANAATTAPNSNTASSSAHPFATVAALHTAALSGVHMAGNGLASQHSIVLAAPQVGHPPHHGITVHPRSGPQIGDPPISATEGVLWSGTLATITDSDGDDSSNQGQFETISGTIDYGDGNSQPFSVMVPEGGSASVFGSHTWTETGTFTVTITATDSDGGSSQASETASVSDGALAWNTGSFNPVWLSNPFEAAPSLTAPASQSNSEGDKVFVPVMASDSDGDTLSYAALDLPAGLSIDPSSGMISGTVAHGDAADFDGSYNPTIIVADGHGGSAQASFSWTISPAQVAPVLTSPGNQTNLRGDNVSLQLNTTQVDNDPITYAASNLPTGLSLDSETGLISGTVDPSATLGTPYSVTVTATDDTTNLSASQSFNWTINATNVAPVLTSPGNQSNSAGDPVSLSLSATDADGDALTYTATGLPPGLTLDPIAGTISGTLPSSAASSTPYNVTVTASDGVAGSSQIFTWAVHAVSLQSPSDQSNVDGDNVSVQLAASDANNATLSYSASGLPPGLSINSSTGLISGTLSSTADTNSPYSVAATATDSNNDSVSQTFNWTVARLSLNAVNDQENQEGSAVSLQMSATDKEGTPTYSASGLPPGLSINSTTGLISGMVGLGSFGSSPYQVTVTATDGSYTSSQAFVWTLTPRVALVNPGDQSNGEGDPVSLQVSATSPGGTMSYSASGLPAGLSINSSTGLISGTIASGDSSASPYMVTVTANDGTSSSSQTFAWTISVINLVSPGDQTNNDGDNVSLSLTTGYHGSGTLSYSAIGLPPGLSINSSTGQITGTLSGTADTTSPYSVTVTVTDGTNTSTQSFDWAINPVVTIDVLDDQSNADGDTASLQITASDTLNNTLSYSATNLPSGLSIDSTTGLISGTIATGADTSNPYAVTVTVTDSAGNSATLSFNWIVTHVSLVNPGPLWSVDGQSVSLPLQGQDADGDTVSYTASGLPSGLSISSSTGLISGTIVANADANSPYNVTISASDGSNTTTQTFLWTVSQVTLTLPSDQTNTEGDTVSLQLQGLASSGTLTYNASGLPAGLSLNPTTGLISGTIAAGAAANGPYTVNVSVSNGTDSASQSFTWTVNPVVNLTTPADQSNNVGDSVSLQVSASDTLNRTLTYSAAGLPTGLSISSTSGLISGTITAGDASGGPYVTTVTASDGTYSSSTIFNWNVTDTTPLTMTAPSTQVNVASDSVSVSVHASDPDGDVLTYSATNLPDGLDIDPSTGIISGVIADDAADPAPYQVTVTATDGNGRSVSQTFTWIVNAPVILDPPLPLNLVEGVDPGSFTLATFTTLDLNSLADDFTATIDYGDGSTDTGAISGGNGSFTVTGDHIYAEKGSYAVTITLSNALTGATSTDTTTATVADAALHLTGGFEEGDATSRPPSSFLLATFTDDNAGATLTDFSATANWGDGSGDPGIVWIVDAGNGLYEVMGSHSYAGAGSSLNSYTVTVTVTDVDGSSGTTTSTVVVGEVWAGVPAVSTSMTFTDANTDATASDFVADGQSGVAVINWGDGTSSLVQVEGGPGNGSQAPQFNMQTSHVYAEDSLDQPNGQYQVTVTITDDDGNTLTGTSYISVVRPNESLDVANVDIASSLTVSNVPVAVFTVPDGVDAASEFSAQIDWGDGNTSSGTIQELSPGLFQVLGSHTYATYDWYTMTVTISQGWGGMAADAKGGGLDGGKPMIEILNVYQKPTTSLRVAKWENAFQNNKATIDTGPRPQPRLEPDFNYRDPDRFYVKVEDLAEKKDTIVVNIQTKGPNKDYNNPTVELDLKKNGVFKGIYESEPMLLMSDATDDSEPINGVANNAKNDLSYIVSLGGTVVVNYDQKTAEAKVPKVKEVDVAVAVLNDPKTGMPVISKKQLADDIQVANERYAQAGIVIKMVDSKIGVNVPGVDLRNGYNVALQKDRAPLVLTDEEKALLGNEKVLPRKANVINVYYVNAISSPAFPSLDGWAYAPNFQTKENQQFAPSVVLVGNLTKLFVLPHELGHVLLNDKPGAYLHSDIATNLMFYPEINKQNQGILGTKRLTTEQVDQMLKNSASLLKTPSS